MAAASQRRERRRVVLGVARIAGAEDRYFRGPSDGIDRGRIDAQQCEHAYVQATHFGCPPLRLPFFAVTLVPYETLALTARPTKTRAPCKQAGGLRLRRKQRRAPSGSCYL